MIRASRLATAAAGALALVACRTAAPSDAAPAVLTNPTVETRAELAQVVSSVLGGVEVTLADDALTRESTLIVERVRPRDAHGLLLNGRVLGKPEHFRLVQEGARCVLIQESTGKRQLLTKATCKPV